MQKIKKILRIVLFPLSLVYGFIIYVRNRLYDYKILTSHQFNIPIISVGNITVGGTGKTPHIEYLVNLLKDDFKLATLSRGYKRKTKGFFLSNIHSTDREIGDEPRQIKQKYPDIEVAVDAKRVNGINQLISRFPNLNVILLDDAFQHRKVKPSLSVLLVDYNRPLLKDFIMPLGMLREQAFEKKRADIIIVTKCPENFELSQQEIFKSKLNANSKQQIYFTCFEYGKLKNVFRTTPNQVSYDSYKDYDILMLTGIANPKPLKSFLEKNVSEKIHLLTYPDHYDFKDSDINNIQRKYTAIQSKKKVIVTTEKDVMRLQKFKDINNEFKEAFYFIPIQVKFLNNQSNSFNKQVINHVRKN